MFQWPYILAKAKERRRRSTVTPKRMSSLPSLEKNEVEITSVWTKKTAVTCDDFMFHSPQKLSAGSPGSVFQWISEDQALHSPKYETWLGLDRTRAPYSAPGTSFSSLTERLRDSVSNSWDEIWETEPFEILKKVAGNHAKADTAAECPVQNAGFQALPCSPDLWGSNGTGTACFGLELCSGCILHTCFSRWSGVGWSCGSGRGSRARLV